MAHNKYMFGWIEEATEGVRVRDGTPADTQMYNFGIFPEPMIQIPHPKASIVQRYVYNNWDVASQSQGLLTIPHTMQFIIVNGIEFYFAMGDSTNTAPSYEQHVIQGIDSGHLPTRTFHYEATGGDTDYIADFVGRKTVSAEFQAVRDGFLTASITSLGAAGTTSKQAIFDNNLGSGPAVEYTTNASTFPPTANVDPYMFNADYVAEWDSGAENTIQSWKLSIFNPMNEIYLPDTTNDDYGVDLERWPVSTWERGKRKYMGSLIVHQNDRNIWDDMMDALTNKTFATTWERGTNDNIVIEMLNCQVSAFEIRMPQIKDTGVFEILIAPQSVDVTVQDEIDADGTPNFYGG